METKWLHNPTEGDTTLYYRRRDGIMVEHMLRPSKFNMRYNHFHQEYEVYLLLKGCRQIFFDNRAYMAEPGSLILVDSGQIHMSHSAQGDPTAEYERMILYIDRNKVEQYDRVFPELKMAEFLHRHYGIYKLTDRQLENMLGMYRAIMQEMDQQLPLSQTSVDLRIISAFIDFWRGNTPVSFLKDKSSSKNTGKYTAVYAVSDYVSTHFCEAITLDDLASRFYISKYYLSRSFREVTGVGISEYVNILRVQRAQSLLQDRSMTISQVAAAVGFESISYFEKIFKRHLALAPAQYRKQLGTSGTGRPQSTDKR